MSASRSHSAGSCRRSRGRPSAPGARPRPSARPPAPPARGPRLCPAVCPAPGGTGAEAAGEWTSRPRGGGGQLAGRRRARGAGTPLCGRPKVHPTGIGHQTSSGAGGVLGAARGRRWGVPTNERPRVARSLLQVYLWGETGIQEVEETGHGKPSAPREPGAAVGGGTPGSVLPLAAPGDARCWSPKEPLSRRPLRPLLLSAWPGCYQPLRPRESSISDLEPRRKAPRPARGTSSPPPCCSPAWQPRRGRSVGYQAGALSPAPLSLPAAPESSLLPQGQTQTQRPCSERKIRGPTPQGTLTSSQSTPWPATRPAGDKRGSRPPGPCGAHAQRLRELRAKGVVGGRGTGSEGPSDSGGSAAEAPDGAGLSP